MTLGEAEAKRQKAVDFLRRIGNDDLADKFDAMTPEEYAEHKGAELLQNSNPQRRYSVMAVGKTKTDLQTELDEANDYIEELESKLDDIVGIAADEVEAEDNDHGSEEDQEDDEQD